MWDGQERRQGYVRIKVGKWSFYARSSWTIFWLAVGVILGMALHTWLR